MGINDISLTSGMRKNLISLQNTVGLLDRTQERLSTGKQVNSALDSPINFFAARAHMNRASDLDSRKDAMGEALQLIKTTDAGIVSQIALIQNAKGLTQSARSASASNRAALADQYNEMLVQITNIALDSSYKGKNLLLNESLKIDFNEDGSSSLTIQGFDASSASLGLTASVNDWATEADIDAAVAEMDLALANLRTESANLAANLSVVSVRQDFTQEMINNLTEGADNLTLADMNEEGANMLMLQTRQALGTTALSLSSQAAASVLRLF